MGELAHDTCGAVPRQCVLRVVSRCTSPEQFIHSFRQFCDGKSLFIATPKSVATRQPIPFAVQDRTPRLHIRSTPPGAAIRVDGRSVGEAPVTVRVTGFQEVKLSLAVAPVKNRAKKSARRNGK